MLERAASLALAPALLGLADACGSSGGSVGSGGSSGTAEALSGTIHFVNYPNWIGKGEYAGFHAKTGVTVKETPATGGDAAVVALIHSAPTSYDMVLGSVIVEILKAGGLWEPPDFSNIPNLANIPDFFKKEFPYGIPTDYGRIGIAYRKDLIPERPTSWHDLWALAPKYSGKVTFMDFDVDVLGAALLYLGYSINTDSNSQIDAAKNALIEIKPHIQAFLQTDTAKPLAQGSAVLAATYDYDVAAVNKNPNIVWVIPDEGAPGYVEGWAPIKGTQLMPEVEAFMNYHLEPKVYGSFVDATYVGPSIMPKAYPFDNKSSFNEALVLPPKDYDKLQNEKFVSAANQEYRNKAWEEIQAA
jgi:spermidine/putrescine-binding protein